jgi:hypothetical protein
VWWGQGGYTATVELLLSKDTEVTAYLAELAISGLGITSDWNDLRGQ